MRLGPVLVGFLVGALLCGCMGVCSGALTSAEQLALIADGAYLSSYEQGQAVGGLLAGPCCVAFAGGVVGAIVGMGIGIATKREE